jgi:hypothetical protein
MYTYLCVSRDFQDVQQLYISLSSINRLVFATEMEYGISSSQDAQSNECFLVFRDVTSKRFVVGYQGFAETCCLHLPPHSLLPAT